MISWGSSQTCSFFEPFIIKRLVSALCGFLHQRHEFQISFKALRPRDPHIPHLHANQAGERCPDGCCRQPLGFCVACCHGASVLCGDGGLRDPWGLLSPCLRARTDVSGLQLFKGVCAVKTVVSSPAPVSLLDIRWVLGCWFQQQSPFVCQPWRERWWLNLTGLGLWAQRAQGVH